MEQLAHKWAQKIGTALNADQEKIAVMAYGLTALLQLLLIFAAALLFGLLFGFLWEAMIVFFSVGFLRRLIGGAHAGTFNGCMVISVVCIVLFSALAHYVLPLCGFWAVCIASVLIDLLASFLIYRYAPVDSPNKPVRSPEKIRRLRRGAGTVMAAFILLTVVLLFLSYRNSVWFSYIWAFDLSVLWQVCMLTAMGRRLICVVDHLIKVP